jgi:hypothetical protein
MFHRFLSAAAAVLFCCSCTFLVRSMLDEKADAVTDVTEDVGEPEPDFNPESCAFWGLIYPEDPVALAIDPTGSDTHLDGVGDVIVAVGVSGDMVYHTIPPINIGGGFYYCVSTEELSLFTDGIVYVNLIDWAESLQGNAYLYQTLLSDPVDYMLAINYAVGRPIDPTVAPAYWNGGRGARMDIALRVRISRYRGTVQFSTNYPDTPVTGRSPRLCLSAYGDSGLTQPGYELALLGSRVVDLTDEAVVAGNTWDFDMNVAVKSGQQFFFYFEYVENRGRFGDDQPCGTEADEKYCFSRNLTMDPGSIGGVMVDPNPYGIEPITGPCDL